MLVLIGAAIVFASTLGGFMLAGGKPMVLLHVSEFVVILGVATGVLIIASPMHVLKEIIHKVQGAIAGKTAGKNEFFELLKLLYELFMIGRRNGLIALEEHVMDPQKSSLSKNIPPSSTTTSGSPFCATASSPSSTARSSPTSSRT